MQIWAHYAFIVLILLRSKVSSMTPSFQDIVSIMLLLFDTHTMWYHISRYKKVRLNYPIYTGRHIAREAYINISQSNYTWINYHVHITHEMILMSFLLVTTLTKCLIGKLQQLVFDPGLWNIDLRAQVYKRAFWYFLVLVLCMATQSVFQCHVGHNWNIHDDVIKWKHLPRYWPFVRGIHRSPVIFPHKGQWREALMFSLICVWINGWVNNREAGDLRRYRAHFDVTLMIYD